MDCCKIQIKRTRISENDKLLPDKNYTSFNENKGQRIVLCLRDVKTLQLHNSNLVMYVALHELAHMACPEYGHTPLFVEIFKYILITAIELNIYQKQDFQSSPQTYCGITIREKLV